MDHVVYVDVRDRELEKLLTGKKRMIVRGASGRKMPYGRVRPHDRLFFVQNDGKCQVHACAEVTMVFDSPRLVGEESRLLIEGNQDQLQLSQTQTERWIGKRYLVLISVSQATAVGPFSIDRNNYGAMDDWLPVGDIQSVCVDPLCDNVEPLSPVHASDRDRVS